MSSISHSEDKKRRGFLGLFGRKAKSSTGDSSVSSGSAGERSVSPARSDESVEGRPGSSTAFNLGSSSSALNNINYTNAGSSSSYCTNSLNNSMNNINTSSSRLSRPVSMVSLSAKKKKAPPIPPQGVQSGTSREHSNVQVCKAHVTTEVKKSLSRNSSDSSGYHEAEAKSSHTSPSSSELSSLDTSRLIFPVTSNLTTVASNSVMSATSKSKRKAPPPPPSKLPARRENSTNAIPESPEEVTSVWNESNKTEIIENSSSLSSETETSNSTSTRVGEKLSSATSTQGYTDICLEDVKQDPPERNKSTNVSNNCSSSFKNHTKRKVTDTPCPNDDKEIAKIPLPISSNDDNCEARASPNKSDLVEKRVQTNGSSPSSVAESPTSQSVVDKIHPINNVESSKLDVDKIAFSSSSPVQTASESEVQTRTVSLSSESSSSSVEVINLKDIQKPKRHKRKSIPESFMVDSPNDSFSLPESQRKNKNDFIPKINKNDDAQTPICTQERRDFDRSICTRTESIDDPDRISLNEAYNPNIEISKFPVMYIEMSNEKSCSDNSGSSVGNKVKESSSIQIPLDDNEEQSSSIGKKNPSEKFDIISDSFGSSKMNESPPNLPPKRSKGKMVTEIKSAVEIDGNQPRILNLKLKEKDSTLPKSPSDYNVILSKVSVSTSKTLTSTDSPPSEKANSFKELKNNKVQNGKFLELQKGKSSAVAIIAVNSSPKPDSVSSTKSSRKNYISSNEDHEFIQPKVPGFSISTYQSRANKISYNKMLSRSESMSSVKDLTNTNKKSPIDEGEGRQLTRSDSQRNEVFRSNNIKKATSTTLLYSNTSKKLNDENSFRMPVLKSRSKSSLFENRDSTSLHSQSNTIQFEISSIKEPVVFTRPTPKFCLSNMQKAKSTLAICGGPEVRIQEDGPPQSSDNGLNNEYIRLQDDFMKWQQQLMQNQQLLHNRVVPIASNPHSMNGPGMVNTTGNQPSSAQPRRPVEISIPIRFEDTGEIVNNVQPATQQSRPQVPPPQFQQPRQQPPQQVNPILSDQSQNEIGSNFVSFSNSPNVSVGAWRERPSNSAMQPTIIDSSPSHMNDPFGQPAGLQTVYQSDHSSQPNVIFNNVQQTPRSNTSPMPQNLNNAQSYPDYHNTHESDFSAGPAGNIHQEPPSRFQQAPPPSKRPQREMPHPESNSRFANRDSSPVAQNSSKGITIGSEIHSPNDDNINARFSSIVTLSDDNDNKSGPQKGKVRSVVQLNNTDLPPLGSQSAYRGLEGPPSGGPSSPRSVEDNSVAPVSSRLVQQAVNRPSSSSPTDRIESLRPSPSKTQPSFSSPDDSSRPFGGVKLLPAAAQTSPLRSWSPDESSSSPQMPVEPSGPPAPPPPPPPPLHRAPPPPPPTPSNSDDSGRPSGRSIPASANIPPTANDAQLDNRDQLMMAIRQFGNNGKLRRSPHPPPCN